MSACGNDTSNTSAREPTENQKKERQLQDEYQTLFKLFKEYVVRNASLSSALQDQHFEPGSPELTKLRDDERLLQTLLNICYEYAYRTHNFTDDHFRRMSDTASEYLTKLKSDAPKFDDLPIAKSIENHFIDSRNAYLDYAVVYYETLGEYVDAAK